MNYNTNMSNWYNNVAKILADRLEKVQLQQSIEDYVKELAFAHRLDSVNSKMYVHKLLQVYL